MTRAPAFPGFPDETFRFLRGLSRHNDKDWFERHRAEYDAGYVEPAKAFVAAMGPRLRAIAPEVGFEPRVNGSIFRIHRDVRFSKDKTPYKDHLDLWFWIGERRGWDTPGFFFRMFHDRLLLGAGMHRFDKSPLDRYRRAVLADRTGRALAGLCDEVRAAGYSIGGATRKTVPRGLDPAHPRAALLLHEGLWAERDVTISDEPRSPAFADSCASHWAACWPIARWIVRALATDG